MKTHTQSRGVHCTLRRNYRSPTSCRLLLVRRPTGSERPGTGCQTALGALGGIRDRMCSEKGEVKDAGTRLKDLSQFFQRAPRGLGPVRKEGPAGEGGC